MAKAVRVSEPELFSTMNVTPFIDVMLVLLIMMILTLPPQNHKVAIDLPNSPLPPTSQPELHMLAIEPGGGLLWDGARIAESDLRATLVDMQANPNAVLQMRTDSEARYERFDQVLTSVKRAGVTKLAFVGNEAFRGAID